MATGLDAQHKIFLTNPDDRRAFEALEEHYFLEGDWERLVELYRARIDAPSVQEDLNLRGPLLFRLGQILEERVLDMSAASETYWTLARQDPSNRPALRQLRGIHERRGQWDMVLQIAEIESQASMPAYERAAFEAELGRTWLEHLGDPDEACAAYERALESDPESPAALEGLARIHGDAGRHREAAMILERLTDRLRGPERAPVWIALGSLYAGPLDARIRARQCFRAALDDDPFQPAAVEWSLLLATEAEDWSAVSDLLENRFDLAAGARARAAIAVEASQIQLHHLGASARARAWVERARELSSDELSVLLAAGDVERADGDQTALLGFLDAAIRLAGKHTPRNVLVEAAELHLERGETEDALARIREVSERPGRQDLRVLLLQARLLREEGAKRELADVLETLAGFEAGTTSEERIAWLEELATLQEEELGDVLAARTTWRQAFDLAPGTGVALEALERLYPKEDDAAALRPVLEAAVAAEGEDAPPALLARLGQQLVANEETDAARRLFDRALDQDPECLPALHGLRALADASGDPELMLRACEREARSCDEGPRLGELVRTMVPLFDARDELPVAREWLVRWTDAAPRDPAAWRLRAETERRLDRAEEEVASRRQLARLVSGDERVATLERQAHVHRTLDQPTEAAAALEQALEEEPGSIPVLESLAESYRDLDRPQDLVRVLRLLADQLPVEDQAEALEELASTLHDPLGDLDTAIVVRWRMADLPDAPAEAPIKLEGLLEQAGRYEELVQLLTTRRQRLADDTDEAFALDLRRGTLLLDSLGHCDEAAELFRALHQRHPDNDEILELYERALRSGDDAASLCELLARRAEWATNDEDRATIELERATLTEESLGERARACDLYARLLRDHPEAPAADEADRRLEALLEAMGDWPRLRDHLETRTNQRGAAEESVVRERIARICRERLNDLPGCAEQLERIAELVDDRSRVWQQLGELYGNALNRPADWLRVVEAELAEDPEAERERNLRVHAARLHLDPDRRPAGAEADTAYDHYERVLALDPRHAEAAEALAHHYARTERPDDAVRVLDTRLDHLSEAEAEEASDLALRIGRLHAEARGDDESARPWLERARTALGANDIVCEPLALLYERQRDAEALFSLADDRLLASNAGVQDSQWRLRRARAALDTDRFEEAATSFRQVLVDRPDDREAEDALIDVYERLGETEPLIDLLEKRLPYARQDETIELRLKLATLHENEEGQTEEALGHLETLLASHPHHRDAFDRALALAESLDAPNRLLALLDRGLETTLPNEERATLLERRGQLLADALDRPDQAVLSYREALACDAQRESVRRALRSQLERLGRWPAVLDCLYVEAMESPTETRLALLEEAAELAWSKVSPDASLPWLARLREARPEDPEVFARIAEVHRRAGRFEAALQALDEELARRTDDEERAKLHVQRAHLLERELNAPSRAIQAYKEAQPLAANPDEILRELDRLFDLMARPSDRAEILEARIERLPEAERTPLRSLVAALFCADLSKPERAIPHLRANVDATSGGRERMAALVALEAAQRAANKFDGWVQTAEEALALIEADPEVAETTTPEFARYLREELARTWDESIGDPDRALGHVRALCEGPESSDPEASARLRALLRRTGRRTELARALERHLDGGNGDASDWLELAQLREESLLDLPGACDAFAEAERASAHDPTLRLEALRGQRRTHERLGNWTDVISDLEREADESDPLERNERGTLARRAGALAWQRLGSAERGLAAYQKALDLDVDDAEALHALIEIRESTEAWEEAALLYRQEQANLAGRDADRPRRRQVWLRLAEIEAQHCDRPEQAIAAYLEAAEFDRLEAPDELRLARLHERTDDTEAFCETFGRWCDREDADARVEDHLELARTLAARGEATRAHARAERATVVAPESAEAWRLRAELDQAEGQLEEAAEAFARAADHATPALAPADLLAAATCLESRAPERAREWLIEATNQDPGLIAAHATRTRVAARLERDEETEAAALRTIELARDGGLEDELRLEVAALGGAAARRLEHRDAMRSLFEEALEIDPDHAAALDGVALARFEDGDFEAARPLLERRIELPDEDPDRAFHLAAIARGLESTEHLDGAWSRYEEALELDPELESAYEGLARVHERAGRPEDAMKILERYARVASEPETAGGAAFRAAEHALALDRNDHALRLLEEATEHAPTLASAWLLRCELAAPRSSDSATKALCIAALAATAEIETDDEVAPLRAPIAARLARLAEVAGEIDEARARYAEAARWDPRASEAALCESRLARRAGEWPDADDVLARFIESHPDSESVSLAPIHLERGRLLAGPLEDCQGAIVAYEKALALQPDLGVARSALGSLLVHVPERWREALALHRGILAANPTSSASLRALVRLAQQRDQSEVADGALVVLNALGLATAEEAANGAGTLRFPIHPGPPMAETESERLRRLAHQVREELGDVLAGHATDAPDAEDPEIAQTIERIRAIEDEITAPGLCRLGLEERTRLFSSLVGLFLDPGGNGADSEFHAPLDQALGRWTRRKARRIAEETTLEAIGAMDHAAWGEELRAMAAAQVVDRSGGAVDTVLRALVVLDPETADTPAFESADLATLAVSSGAARRLLTRILHQLCDRMEQSR